VRYFYDCEFLEDGHTIDLISIGICAEDGREYYAVVSEVGGDDDKLYERICRTSWLMENVVPHLPLSKDWSGNPVIKQREAQYSGSFSLDLGAPEVLPRWVVAKQVKEFLLAGDAPELWAYYGAYDHVALCQLWGPMMRLPKGLPMFTLDLKQEAVRLGDPELPAQDGAEHNALEDARWNQRMFEFLRELSSVATKCPTARSTVTGL